MSNTMWGGRFAGSPAEAMEEINASIEFDRQLAAQDIAGSEAHLAMLARHGHRRSRRRRSDRQGSRSSQRRNRGGDVFVLARARRHPYEHRKPLKRNCRPRGGTPAHRALAQRPGRRRLPALGARRHRRDPLADRSIATRARPPRARDCRHGHAGLHPSAIGAAGHLRPSSPGLCRDAGARRRALQGRAQAPQRMSRSARPPLPARRSRSTAT